ncbi:YeaC family protein [Vibrio maritimus]|uniref:Uncharacterized protein YeaC n=1 Tax=Vibrio variabilis TaxID=990271 RepID=A0ABQ0JAP2_9VIBR|nr:DUF1315 family protein [Vibrio maritimus]GAL25840.1 uncharacterized protein YeaC [Vibrio variabilis]
MDVEQLLEAMTPDVYERLLYATETGRWPEGSRLSPEQRDSCMQAVMLYQSKHNVEPQHMSVAAGGDITFKSKAELKNQFADNSNEIARVKVSQD